MDGVPLGGRRCNFTRGAMFFSRYVFKASAPQILRVLRRKKEHRDFSLEQRDDNIIWHTVYKHRRRLLLRPYFYLLFYAHTLFIVYLFVLCPPDPAPLFPPISSEPFKLITSRVSRVVSLNV